MKLAVVGTRTFDDYAYLKEMLDTIHVFSTISLIVTGGDENSLVRVNTDEFAVRWAKENNVEYKVILPDWQKHGKSAGFIRNNEIWDNVEEGLAFWDGKSKGTAHSFEIARRQGKKITICEYKASKPQEKGQMCLF